MFVYCKFQSASSAHLYPPVLKKAGDFKRVKGQGGNYLPFLMPLSVAISL